MWIWPMSASSCVWCLVGVGVSVSGRLDGAKVGRICGVLHPSTPHQNKPLTCCLNWLPTEAAARTEPPGVVKKEEDGVETAPPPGLLNPAAGVEGVGEARPRGPVLVGEPTAVPPLCVVCVGGVSVGWLIHTSHICIYTHIYIYIKVDVPSCGRGGLACRCLDEQGADEGGVGGEEEGGGLLGEGVLLVVWGCYNIVDVDL